MFICLFIYEGARSSPDCVPALDMVFRAEARFVNVARILSSRHEHCQRPGRAEDKRAFNLAQSSGLSICERYDVTCRGPEPGPLVLR
jgi:hypothetical protein